MRARHLQAALQLPAALLACGLLAVPTTLAGAQPATPPLALQPPLDADTVSNGAQITVRGRTAAGATVTLKLNGKSFVVKSGADGLFAFFDVPLAAGANNVQLTAVDANGNVTAIDRNVTWPGAPATRPAGPQAPNPDALRLGGLSIELSGTAAPDALVAVTRDGVSVGATKADANGQWRVPLDLADGGWTLVITTAPGGTRVLRLEIDRHAPDVQLVSPGPSDYVEVTPFAFGGRTEPGAVLAVRGDTSTSKVTADGKGFFTLTDVPVVDGVNHYALTLTDDLGNSRSVPITVWGRVSNPLITIQAPAEGWQRTKQTEFAIEHEAGATVSATLNGQPVEVVGTKPVPGDFPVPRESSLLDPGPLPAGPYELAISVVSPSGLRRSGVIRKFHLPGAPRSLLWSAQPRSAGTGGKVALGVEVFDPWRQHVADGTSVLIEAPEGWTIDGALPPGTRALAKTRDGQINVTLSPTGKAVPGIVLVTSGLVNESVALNVGRP